MLPGLHRAARNRRRGFTLVVTTILLGIVMSLSIIVLDTTLNSRRTAEYNEGAQEAVLLAEAGIHKAMYCLKATNGANCGGNYGSSYTGESNVAFGGGKFTVAVAGSGATKTITATGTSGSGVLMTVKTSTSTAAPSVAQSGFDLAVQASDLGVNLQNNASVNNGTVYTDSDVVCGNNAEVNYDIYVSRSGGKIDNCDGVINGHADKILNSQVLGNAYYKVNPTDIAGTSVAGTKYANQMTPAPRLLPTFDKAFWEDVAETGGIIAGGYTLTNNASGAIGPAKITGDLSLSNNATLTLNGPIWVVGNVTIGNNVTIQLATGFGSSSGVIIADNPADTANGGIIDISNNAVVSGSGSDGSYMLMYTTNTRTSDTSPAIKVANNAAGGIFYAPNGSVRIHNNGSAIAALGRRVYLDNNAAINYDSSGVTPASMTLATVVGGTWRFLAGAWRQFK